MIYHGLKSGDGTAGLSDLRTNVQDTVEALRPRARLFDSIIVTGLSGTLVGAPVSIALEKPLCVLRKRGELRGGDRTHDYGRVVNRDAMKGARVLILDDFVSGGYTRSRLIRAAHQNGGHIVAQYMYRGWNGDGWTEIGAPYELLCDGDGWDND